MNRTSGTHVNHAIIRAFWWTLGVGAFFLAGSGCQQMAAVNSAANTIQKVQVASTQASQVADSAVQAGQLTAQAAVTTAANAVNAVPGGPLAWNAIPQQIVDGLASLVSSNNLNWGKPSTIYYADGRYIFVYPNAWAPFQASKPRVIIIDTVSQVDRLKHIEKYGY